MKSFLIFIIAFTITSSLNAQTDTISSIRKEYTKDGKLLILESKTVNGIETGIIKSYYPSGKLKLETPFVHKVNSTGEGDIYNAPHQMHVKGTIHGIVKEYYESGVLKSEINFNNDAEGATKKYDEKGNLIH